VTKRCGILAYELQVVASMTSDVLHDVAMGHPFGDRREHPVLEGVENADEIKDVGMG
jgi:hypothetical protein